MLRIEVDSEEQNNGQLTDHDTTIAPTEMGNSTPKNSQTGNTGNSLQSSFDAAVSDLVKAIQGMQVRQTEEKKLKNPKTKFGISESRLTSSKIFYLRKTTQKQAMTTIVKMAKILEPPIREATTSHRHNLFDSPESSIEALCKKDGRAWHSRQMACFLHTQMMLG